MLLLCRFDVPAERISGFLDDAERALTLLTGRPGCLGGELARATEEADTWVLTIRFESVVAYRRAMSGFEVREHVIPFLSTARVEQPAAYELVITAADGVAGRHASLLAKDADTAGPGRAAGRAEPR